MKHIQLYRNKQATNVTKIICTANAHQKGLYDIKINGNYQSVAVHVHEILMSTFSNTNTTREYFKSCAEHLIKCCKLEHGLSGHRDRNTKHKADPISGINTT